MKKLISLSLIVLLCIFAVGSYANSREGDFIYSEKGKRITIVKYQGTSTDSLYVPSEINGKPVTVIGEKAFERCPASSIILPDSISEIKFQAFYYAEAENIEIPDVKIKIDAEAFMCCYNLEEIRIPKSISFNKGGNPFRGCRSLKSIVVDPENKIYSIYENALIEKKTMKLITYPLGLVETELIIPDGIKIIGNTAFGYEGPRDIERIVIPDTVNTIETSAFAFSDAQEITIGSGVKKMGNGTFSYSKKLETVTIANGTSVVGNAAFGNCTNLKTIVIPNSVKKIANNAFDHVDLVQFITNPKSVAATYAKKKGIEVISPVE